MLIPVILSGGSGSRLWPVSRESHPKPFMQLADGETLLAKTFSRAAALPGVTEILTVTNREYFFATRDEYARLKQSIECTYLLEPSSRNTAPALLMAAIDITERYGPNTLMLVLPADHLITPISNFIHDVEIAAAAAKEGQIVVFGIPPKSPETGYGYIEAESLDHSGICNVIGFKEKPDQETAEHYVRNQHYFWNAGMLCLTAATVLRTFSQHQPALLKDAQSCWDASNLQPDEVMRELDAASFAACESISVDYAILEKADSVKLMPATFSWSDIGSWASIAELAVPDERDNRSDGDVVMVNSDRCYIRTDRLVATVGVKDLIVIDTPDALLVVHKNSAQDVKLAVAALKKINHDSVRIHRTVARPWGTYSVLDEGLNYKIKRIEVHCGGTLSLQMHHHRSEHWIVVSGIAKVTSQDRQFLVHTNESTYIPAGHSHRLENPGKIPLIMIEVQSGQYVGEDDIIRFDDIYGRVPVGELKLQREEAIA